MQQSEEMSIVARLDKLRADTNFYTKQIYIRDQLVLNVFVNFDKLDLEGKPIGDTQTEEPAVETSSNPGQRHSQEEEETKEENVDSSDCTDSDSDEDLQLGFEANQQATSVDNANNG